MSTETKIENKIGYDVTFRINKQGNNYRVSWGDLLADGDSFEVSCRRLISLMHDRFIVMAETSNDLNEGGQKRLEALCAIFAPEKLEEAAGA